ncbi:MAG: flagellar biosynthesis protein FlhF [Dethiobacter sp.]|nr:MAG: flagellar biosynthesis protein FlhF [Dethiobacter sp.]
MKIKRYRVSSMREGLAQIRKEMGSNAVIIESKKRRQKGLKGFFLPKTMEITAAVDTNGERQEEYKKMPSGSKNVDDELNELKSMMQIIISQQENNLPQGSSAFNYWLKRLTDNDVDRDYALEILSGIQTVSEGKNLTAEITEMLVLNRINKTILTKEIHPKAKHISFVGPTGVGKTTTLAKLAANFAFKQGKKVAIITADTYRIGAVEQLKTYTEITGIPLEVVYTLKEMHRAVEKCKEFDFILIDTAGRSAKNSLHIAETAQYINCLSEGIVFLVVSATTKMRDLHKITQAYKRSNYNSLILTKLDETETFGTILNVCRLTALPIAYITTGQNVPDDIEPANASRLADMVLGEDQVWLTKQKS